MFLQGEFTSFTTELRLLHLHILSINDNKNIANSNITITVAHC